MTDTIRLLAEWMAEPSEEEYSMTDLEMAVLNILVKSECALTLTDLYSLLNGGRDVLPLTITEVLITLEDKGLIRNELSWRALPSRGESETKT